MTMKKLNKRQALRLSLAGAGGFSAGAAMTYLLGFGWTMVIVMVAYIFMSVLSIGEE
jgi:hypothetical protein